jgi:hypothetical protein
MGKGNLTIATSQDSGRQYVPVLIPWQRMSLFKSLNAAVETLYMLENVLQFIREDKITICSHGLGKLQLQSALAGSGFKAG